MDENFFYTLQQSITPFSFSSPVGTPKHNIILSTQLLPLTTNVKGKLSLYPIPHDSVFLESLTRITSGPGKWTQRNEMLRMDPPFPLVFNLFFCESFNIHCLQQT